MIFLVSDFLENIFQIETNEEGDISFLFGFLPRTKLNNAEKNLRFFKYEISKYWNFLEGNLIRFSKLWFAFLRIR